MDQNVERALIEELSERVQSSAPEKRAAVVNAWYSEAKEQHGKEAADTLYRLYSIAMNMKNTSEPSPAPPPAWVMITGVVFFAAAVLFLMVLVFFTTITGQEVPCSARIPVVFIMSLVLAAGVGFVGGDAYAKGSLGFFKKLGIDNPIYFGATGGVGAFVVCLLIGYLAYSCATP